MRLCQLGALKNVKIFDWDVERSNSPLRPKFARYCRVSAACQYASRRTIGTLYRRFSEIH